MMISCNKDEDLVNVDEVIWVRSNGADMPVHVHGTLENSTIILIVHGGPGGNGLEYRSGKYTEPLEARYAMAYWDQRGQGMSHGHYSDGDVTVSQMADDLDAVIKVLKAKYGANNKLVVLGHSWGGTLTAKYMVTGNNQQNVDAWIEANGAHDIPQLNHDAISMFINVANQQIAAQNNVANWQGILDWASGIDSNNVTSEQSGEINQKGFEVEAWLTEDGVMQEPEQGGTHVPGLSGPTNPLTSFLAGSATSNLLNDEVEATALTSQLSNVTIPTLVLWGRYDFVVPVSLGYDTYDNISSTNKQIVIFEKSGHSPMSNEWEAFSNSIISFVDGL